MLFTKKLASGEVITEEVEDTMRHNYRELSQREIDNIRSIKDQGKFFWDLCDELGPSREMSLAKTKIEEAVMWAIKSLTR